MAIEIVDVPIKNGDFPWQNVSSPEGNQRCCHDATSCPRRPRAPRNSCDSTIRRRSKPDEAEAQSKENRSSYDQNMYILNENWANYIYIFIY